MLSQLEKLIDFPKVVTLAHTDGTIQVLTQYVDYLRTDAKSSALCNESLRACIGLYLASVFNTFDVVFRQIRLILLTRHLLDAGFCREEDQS